MKGIYASDLLKATDGKLLCGDVNTEINNIVIDSREVKPHDLFVPIIGEKVDAHKFIENVAAKDVVVITSEHTEATDALKSSGVTLIAVEETVKAMQAFAAEIRNHYQIPIVGVTGSVGKTTTREMIYKALSAGKNVIQTYKNYNSQVGVPMMLSRFEDEYEMGVLEMGMSNPGEMDNLCMMIRPDTAVMTNIGVAHIEQLKTQDGIFEEKVKIASRMDKSNTVFLNADDAILARRGSEINATVKWYGIDNQRDFYATDIVNKGEGQEFTAHTPAGEITVYLSTPGRHNVLNALAALGVALEYGVDIKAAAEALGDFSGSRLKFNKLEKFTIIDDTYNASPDSMKASIQVLGSHECAGRRIAVLADMLELGENTVEYHKSIGAALEANKIDLLITYGELADNYSFGYSGMVMKAESLEAVTNQVIKCVEEDSDQHDLLLFKGSNGMNLKEVVKEILQKY